MLVVFVELGGAQMQKFYIWMNPLCVWGCGKESGNHISWVGFSPLFCPISL